MSALARCQLLLLVGLTGALLAAPPAPSAPSTGTKHAFLIGCGAYEGREMRPLTHPRQDMTAFQAALRETGFLPENIVRMDDGADRRSRPDADRLRQELKRFLDNLEPEDTVVVAYSGHGVQFRGQAGTYLCPLDARLEDRATLLALEEVYHLLEKCQASRKLLLMDACRADPRSETGGPALEDVARPQAEPVPRGVVTLFSCGQGQVGHDHAESGQGLFFHHVAGGWRGLANPGKAVSLEDLDRYVRTETTNYARGRKVTQGPVRRGEDAVTWALRDSPPEPPEPMKVKDKVQAKVEVEPLLKPEAKGNFDLKVRRPADKSLGDDSPRCAVNVFRDPKTTALLYVTQSGSLAIGGRGGSGTDGSGTAPRYLYGLKLEVKVTGAPGPGNPRFTVEVYRDDATRNLIYVSDKKSIAVLPDRSVGQVRPAPRNNVAEYKHLCDVKVRKAGEADFRKAQKITIEIIQDVATSNLIFLSSTGLIAVVPGGGLGKTESGDPDWKNALEVKVRRPDQKLPGLEKKLGIEVFREEFTGNLIYISETGHLAVIRRLPVAGPKKDFVAVPLHGLELVIRTDGTETRKASVEAVRDDENQVVVYVSETGGLALLPVPSKAQEK